MDTSLLPLLVLLRPGTLLTTGSEALRLPSATSFYILAYLTTESTPAARRRIAELFWPDTESAKGLHSLSQQLYRLKSVLPSRCLIASASTIEVREGSITADALLLLNGGNNLSPIERAELYQCDFLAEASFRHEDLNSWCERWRTRLKIAAVELYSTELEKAYELAKWDRVLDLTQKQLQIDPFHEGAASKRAHALAAMGNLSAATAFVNAFRSKFQDTLETDPTIPAPGALVAATTTRSTPSNSVRLDPLPFIGRQAEFERVKRSLEEASSRKLASVLLTGQPGAGKTRFAVHALRWASIRGFTSIYVGCRYSERLLPYGALARYMELLGHDSTPTRPITFTDQLVRTLDEVSRKPLALCFDDVQWMDASSSDFLGIVADRFSDRSVLLLFSARSNELGRSVPTTWRWVNDEIQLAGLTPDEVTRLISEYESRTGRCFQPQHRMWMAQGLAGNPFFIIETLKYLGAAETLSETPVPPSIRRVLRAQIKSLKPHSQRLLSCAAVFGTHASASEVLRAAQLTSWKITDAVEELTTAGLVTFAADQISIRHDLVREAIYGDTPRHVREMIHAAAARALDKSGPDRATEAVRHQYLARDYAKAFRTALAAAAAASTSGGYTEAECFFHLALRTADSLDRKKQAHLAYLAFLCEQRRFIEAGRPARALKRYGCETYDVQLAAALAKCATQIQKASQPITEIGSRLERLASIAHREQLWGRFRDCVVLLAEVAQHDGRFALAQSWADKFLDTARENTDAVVEISGLAATLAAMHGQSRARELSRRSVSDAERTGKPRLVALARSYAASAHMLLGEITVAQADYEAAIAFAEKAGMRDVLFFTEGNSAVALIERADFVQARERLERCLRYVRRVHAFQYANLAVLGIESGDWSLATHSANTLLSAYAGYQVPWIPLVANTALGLAALHDKNMDAATKHVNAAVQLLESAGSALSDRSYSEILIARFRFIQGDMDEAINRLKSARDRLSGAQPLASLRLGVEMADLNRRRGRLDPSDLLRLSTEAEQRGATLIASRARALLAN